MSQVETEEYQFTSLMPSPARPRPALPAVLEAAVPELAAIGIRANLHEGEELRISTVGSEYLLFYQWENRIHCGIMDYRDELEWQDFSSKIPASTKDVSQVVSWIAKVHREYYEQLAAE